MILNPVISHLTVKGSESSVMAQLKLIKSHVAPLLPSLSLPNLPLNSHPPFVPHPLSVINQAKPKSDYEARMFEVLSHKNWGASSSLMNQIAKVRRYPRVPKGTTITEGCNNYKKSHSERFQEG